MRKPRYLYVTPSLDLPSKFIVLHKHGNVIEFHKGEVLKIHPSHLVYLQLCGCVVCKPTDFVYKRVSDIPKLPYWKITNGTEN